MTEVKFFEVRDEGTHIPVLCVKVAYEYGMRGEYQMRRSAFSPGDSLTHLVNLNSGEGRSNPAHWKSGRTMRVAYNAIVDQWEDLKSGDVIDVQYILGETSVKKLSESITSSASPQPASRPSPDQ